VSDPEAELRERLKKIEHAATVARGKLDAAVKSREIHEIVAAFGELLCAILPVRPRNSDRDWWISTMYVEGMTNTNIIKGVNEHKGWRKIKSDSQIVRITNGLCKRYNLTLPSPKKPGRPRKSALKIRKSAD
jgi:hypothetical protein